MKIIYLFTSPSLKGSSVQTKVLNQIKYLNKAGAECRGAFFSTEVMEITPLNEQVDLIPVEKCEWKYFRKIGQRRNLDKKLKEFIGSRFADTDVFYLRYPGASKKLYQIAKKYGNKMVSEHQSKEIDEIKSFENQHLFGIRPSKLLSRYLYYWKPIYNERKWGTLFAKKVEAIVTVTDEIALYQKEKGCKNILVCSNGIGVNSYPLRRTISFSEPLKILFLKGTSSISEWNGFERLISSIDRGYSNKIKLIVCGHLIKGEIPERDYIEHRGYLNKEQLGILFNEAHIGISTLALHKKGLHEAAVLKTREYIARGLPFIYAYTDPDLNEETKPFALQFPNDDSPIDMQQVIDFAQKVLSDPEHPQKMRAYAEKHLDYEVKMGRLLEQLGNLQT